MSKKKENTVKDTLHDFGELGKWSEETLKAQLKDIRCSGSYNSGIPSIEEKFNTLFKLYKEGVNSFSDLPLITSQNKILTIGQISKNIDDLKAMQTKLKELKDSYSLYSSVLEIIDREEF
jgi:hypothetical protein